MGALDLGVGWVREEGGSAWGLVPRTIGLASSLCCPELTPEFPVLLCGWKPGVLSLVCAQNLASGLMCG